MTTVIVPALGAAVLYTQGGTGASPGYSAIDDRRLGSGGLQEGVYASQSYEVTQRAAGSAMFVDIAASTGENGIAAYVQGESVTGQGLYLIAPHATFITEAIAAAHATLPRVDRVILEIRDQTHDGTGAYEVRTRVVTGTATAAATLDNLNGAAAVPSNCLLLADVLIAATDTAITNSEIRDRRKWARGGFWRLSRTTNAAAGNDYTSAATLLANLDATNLGTRIECSGVPLKISILGAAVGSTTLVGYLQPMIDGAGIDGMAGLNGTPTGFGVSMGTTVVGVTHQWVTVPSAGTHVVTLTAAVSTGTMTVRARAAMPLLVTIEELVHQNYANNTVTTG